MNNYLYILLGLLVVFVASINGILFKFIKERNQFAGSLYSYGREFVTPVEYNENDFFISKDVPDTNDFYNGILTPLKKTIFVLREGKGKEDIPNIHTDLNGYFDKNILFKQEDLNDNGDNFGNLYNNVRFVCQMTKYQQISCRKNFNF